jgi:hypothetical protein
MSNEKKNSILWWGKITAIVLAVITMLGILAGGTIFVTQMVARTEILQTNQKFISETQKSVLGRLDENDTWRSNRAVADTMLTVNMRWIYEKIISHENRLNRLDLKHNLFPPEYNKKFN